MQILTGEALHAVTHSLTHNALQGEDGLPVAGYLSNQGVEATDVSQVQLRLSCSHEHWEVSYLLSNGLPISQDEHPRQPCFLMGKGI